MNNSVIKGTEFSYRIDTEHGINHDGFIAEGTESIVFKGVKYGGDLRYSCALKFKPKYRLNDFMQREYKILESMQTCRSVVRVLDVIEDLGDFYLPYGNGEINNDYFFCVVEEYIDGDSLQDYCIKQWFTYNLSSKKWERNTTDFSYREIVKFQNLIIQFMINLCEIMKFISNLNERNGKTDSNKPIILHCDIKPENIMVTKHGRELVLIDFGRSREFREGRTYTHYSDPFTKTFTADYSDSQWQDVGKENVYAYGTVGYAAPECFASPVKGVFPFPEQSKYIKNGCVSVESDIFGFGATFAECLSVYEVCMQAYEENHGSSDPRFFNRVINENYENIVRSTNTSIYCDRDFRNIDPAYHESLENIIRKSTKTRGAGFQNPEETANDYYHNFYQLQKDVERARDSIPSLDRKSDPLVRQMIGISGFCAAFSACAMVLWILMLVFANALATDRWNILTDNYTDNQKNTVLVRVATDMLEVPGKSKREQNFEKILEFMYRSKNNDEFIDSDETKILVSLMKQYISESKWNSSLDTIIMNAKSDNLDEIAKSVYSINLSDAYNSDGYTLASILSQINNSDDNNTEVLTNAYNTLMEYYEDGKDKDYSVIMTKIAIKLMTGSKIDTIAGKLETDRKSLQDSLVPHTKVGDE